MRILIFHCIAIMTMAYSFDVAKSTPAMTPLSLNGYITYPDEDQYNECYMDEERTVKGVCKKLSDCPTVANRWHYQNIRPQTCYFNKFDHIICCAQEDATATADDNGGERIDDVDANMSDKLIESTTKKTTIVPNIVRRRHEIGCDNANLYQVAIIRGEPTVYHEYPFMAALGWKANFGQAYIYYCGGVLVSKTFVLTAAHCAYRGGDLPVVVRTGGVNLTDTDAMDIPIKRIVVHPGYEATSTYNDIALIELMEESRDRAVCVWPRQDFERNDVIAIGYGHTRFAGAGSDQLLKATLHLVSNDECRPFYTNALPNGIIDSQVCAKDPEKVRDTCQGDSGGPILMDVENFIDIRYVVGITSFGLGCANSPPSVYTRVSSYIDWIEDIVWPLDGDSELVLH